jgi:hypothetical protein
VIGKVIGNLILADERARIRGWRVYVLAAVADQLPQDIPLLIHV